MVLLQHEDVGYRREEVEARTESPGLDRVNACFEKAQHPLLEKSISNLNEKSNAILHKGFRNNIIDMFGGTMEVFPFARQHKVYLYLCIIKMFYGDDSIDHRPITPRPIEHE
jgi:hypothetical protein